MITTTYIYTLSHPLTGEVKYVGKSIDTKDRLRQHIKIAKYGRINNLSCNWVKSLLSQGLKPKMDVIDETVGEWEWLEMYWISQFKTWGFKLKNMTDGGDSNPMSNQTSRDKLSKSIKKTMSNFSKEKREKINEKISKSKKGIKVHTEETKKIISKKISGNRNGMYGKKHDTDALQKMKLPVLQYSLEGEFIKEWASAADIDRETKMLARSINRCAKGDRSTAYGYRWEYKNGKGRR